VAADKVYLKGGPCAGREVSADEIQGGLVAYIECGGGYYVATGDKHKPDGAFIFKYDGKTKPGPPGGKVRTPHTHKGWHDLRHSVNMNMPHSIRKSQRSTHAALRALARARKVRH
jgi:hypothetical protein